MSKLQENIERAIGLQNIRKKTLPEYLDTSLNPQKPMRPYQQECMRYLLSYLEDYDERARQPHLLFHKATGSGKTLIMAASILYFYAQGYRNFLFFVGSTNILEKTKENLLNAASAKYLFAPQIVIEGQRVEVRQVENFQGTTGAAINLCLETIQGLHSKLNSNRENALTYDDFADQPVVLISDEAHHMNSATKRGKQEGSANLFGDDTAQEFDDEETRNWETTAMRIFRKNNGRLPNVLLEFTATADLSDPNIAHKYEDKVIYDYPLRRFREDGYSKEVEVVESDLTPTDRALQAVVVSQFKRKLFASIKQDVKPVVMFKLKTIKENEKFFTEFAAIIANLQPSKLEAIKAKAQDVVKTAFDYFNAHGVTLDNLVLELQEDFSEERLLLVDGNNISPDKQLLLNTLEDRQNQVRAVFAVDMLNEGWDVLNLYDIVRLYETRSVVNGKPGKTTMQEAQLIGRGARYMPFADPAHPEMERGMRKYDNDADNPLRVIETLHYHSQNNPRYIQELHTALVKTGIWPETHVERDFFIKPSFKETELYQKGLVFTNEQLTVAEAEADGTIGRAILDTLFRVAMPTGKMRTGLLFGDNAPANVLTTVQANGHLADLGLHVVRAALNRFSTFHFDRLQRLYPTLQSVKEFVTSQNYLKNIKIQVSGNCGDVHQYAQSDKLYIALAVLRQIEPMLVNRGKAHKGSRDFKPTPIKDAFSERKILKFAVKSGGTEEFGRSMVECSRPEWRINLMDTDWYAQNDCYGTSEEKALIAYINGIKDKLAEKYDEFYLVRNEKDIRIFSFETGQQFEPDFVLFLKRKDSPKNDHLQIFIEPKGEHLRAVDKWKQDFLLELKTIADVRYCTSSDEYEVIGLPFFTQSMNEPFLEGFEREVFTQEKR